MVDIPGHWYTIAWVTLLGLMAVVEIMSILDADEGDTLSEHTRRWFGWTGRLGSARKLRRTLFLGLCLWFAVHIATGSV